jgi:hypothetical protein
MLNVEERIKCSEYFNILHDEVEKLGGLDGDFIIYGYGKLGKYIYSLFEDKCCGIVDQSSTLLSTNFDKSLVYSPKNLVNMEYKKIVISVIGREIEIIDYLLSELGVMREDIYVFEIGNATSSSYQPIFPKNNRYTPWNIDNNFMEVYKLIQKYTLVDIYRCYELWSLVRQVAKLDYGALVEVGVWKGGSEH